MLIAISSLESVCLCTRACMCVLCTHAHVYECARMYVSVHAHVYVLVRYHLKFAYHDTIVRVSRYTLGIDTSHDMAYMR